jgi:hypothetical protein
MVEQGNDPDVVSNNAVIIYDNNAGSFPGFNRMMDVRDFSKTSVGQILKLIALYPAESIGAIGRDA